MIKYITLISLLLVLWYQGLVAQNNEALLYEFTQSKGEKKVKIALRLSERYLKTSPIKALNFAKQALKESQLLNHKNLEVQSHFANIKAIVTQYNYTINYQAKEGERISNICERFGVTRAELEKNNFLDEDGIISYHNELTITSKLKFIQPIAYQQVMAHYQKILQLRRQFQDQNFLVFALKSAGDFCQKHGDLTESEKHYQEWLNIRRKQADTIRLSWAISYLANFYIENEQKQKAAKLYEESLAIDKARYNADDYAFSLSQMSLKHPNPDKALLYEQEALTHWLAQDSTWMIEWHRERNRLRDFLSYDYDEDEDESEYRQRQEERLEQNLKLNKISGDTVLLFRAYRDLVYYNLRKEYYHGAEMYSELLWQFMEEYQVFTNENHDVRDIIGELVYTYALYLEPKRKLPFENEPQLNNLYRFIDYYQSHKEIENDWPLFIIYEELDQFYRQNEQYDSAAFFFEKYRGNNVEALDDIAFLNQKTGEYKLALQYFEQALNTQMQEENPIWIAEQLNKIGYLYEVQFKTKLMDNYYQQALKTLNDLEAKHIDLDHKRAIDLAMQLWRISKLYNNRGDKRKAIALAEKSFEVSRILDKLGFSGERRWMTYYHEYPESEKFENHLKKLKDNQ